jgi:hypothetical protein
VALGFVEVTRKGYGGAAEVRAPSLYRLTFRPAWDARKGDTGTHEYLKIKTDEAAEGFAAKARNGSDPRNVERSKIHFATPQNVQISPHEMGGEEPISRPPKRGVQAHPPKRGVLSISREGEGRGTDPTGETARPEPANTPNGEARP